MSQGFVALNDNNQVLISSDTRNLHFVQKVVNPTVDNESDYYGGTRRFRYRVTCNVTPVPFFTMPTTDYYGITAITDLGNGQWDVEMIRSGTGSTYPELYVFSDPRGKTGDGNHGMVVYLDDGTAAFDSRLLPLVVTGGLAVTHPYNPRDSFSGGLSAHYCESLGQSSGDHFTPNQSNSYELSSIPAKPMYHYASLAQAQRQSNFSDSASDCLGFDAYGGCIGYGTDYNWSSHYWCFYRGGIRQASEGHFYQWNYYNAPTVRAGWIAVYYGCNWNYSKDDSLAGIGIGGDGGSGGAWPYSNETLNLSSTSVIIGDASKYD